ncbi:MAG: tRNA epoxyqueuosine(34) reductase QueG [Planctomycetes bacterium]|nr:tRNA epoxyqueuosine(34) reductase QueG [Planctomycetota bacterium]
MGRDAQKAANIVLEAAHGLGFDLVGIAPLRPPRRAEAFRRWLAAGHHAGMDWLERQSERILDPRRILESEGSILVCGVSHARAPLEIEGGGRIARYAAGRDYHNLVGKKLGKLARRLEALGLAGRGRTIVDAGPLLERSHANEAGLGFESRSANLLHPTFGPWFFLGELLLPIELEPTPTPPAASCGTCSACIDACPTDAIPEAGVIDANRCLSYHTIENRGTIPHELRKKLGEWAFGCDVCSEVCPYGSAAPDTEATFGLHRGAETRLVDWLAPRKNTEVADAEFWNGSPLTRAKREGRARNAALVLGNRPTDEGHKALTRALEGDSPLVRAAAFWGLSNGHRDDRGVREVLERALQREEDSDAAADMRTTLAHFG